MSYIFLQASDEHELQQILALQKENIESSISEKESIEQGFVTVNHTFELLKRMNNPHGHIIAKNGQNQIVGYCLVMLKIFFKYIPVLDPLIKKIGLLKFGDKALIDSKYFIMGQVCVGKEARGQGVFSGMYQHLKTVMSSHFDYIITSIAVRNSRSMRAHEKVGFVVIDTYQDDKKDKWVVVLWDITGEHI